MPRYQLTERDIDILRWTGRWRAVTAPQLAREFDRRDGTRRLEIYERRLRALHTLGLTDHARMLADHPTVHWLTRAGMRASGLTGAVPAPRLAELHHDLALVDLAHHVTLRQPDHEVLTETEIRRTEPGPVSDPAAALRAELEIGVTRGTGGRGVPDLASIPPAGGVWVHELERSRKPGPRLERLMLAYVWSEHITGAVYWTSPPLTAAVRRCADAANKAAQETGRTPCIVVREWPDAPTDGDSRGTKTTSG